MLKKLGLVLSPKDVKDIIEMQPEAIERLLLTLRYKTEYYLARRKNKRVDSAAQKRPHAISGLNPPIVSGGHHFGNEQRNIDQI